MHDEVSDWLRWGQRDTRLVGWSESYKVGCLYGCLGMSDDGRMPLESA